MFTIPAIHPNGDGSSYIARILLGNNNNKYKTGQLGNLTITKKHWRRQKIFKGKRRGQGGVDVA